jgi:hypothetical protein
MVSSGDVFRRVANAMIAILVAKGFFPVKNWVDNFVFFRFPLLFGNDPPNFSYSLIDIYNLASHLGWPWKPSKTKSFVSEFKYLGFTWNLANKTVQIPLLKKVCYTTKLEPWITGWKFSRKEVELVLDTLVHCSLALPDDHSQLPSLSCFAASFNFLLSPLI